MPFISSDAVRVWVSGEVDTSGSEGLGISGPFAVRPDSRIGDAPPVVTITSTGGTAHSGGETVPITWTASDDEALRSFSVQVSTTGGRTWHFLAEDLPGSATSFDWTLPPVDERVEDVLVRVLAFDHRFQSSSNTSAPIDIGATTFGDANDDGAVDVDDMVMVITGWGACPEAPAPCDGDVNGDGTVNVDDLVMILVNWGP